MILNFATVKSKTDQYRSVSRVMLAKTGSISFPFYLLQRYIGCAGMESDRKLTAKLMFSYILKSKFLRKETHFPENFPSPPFFRI